MVILRCEICRHEHATEDHAAVVLANRKAKKRRARQRFKARCLVDPSLAKRERDRKRSSYQRNAETVKSRHRVWYEKNKKLHPRVLLTREEKLARQREYYTKTKELRKLREDPQKEKERRRLKQIRDRDAGRRKIVRANRRARLKAAGKLSVGIYERLLSRQRGLCVYCRSPLAGSNAHLDHIMPLALGGSNTDDNVQLLCQSCNQSKHAKHPVEFARERGMLL